MEVPNFKWMKLIIATYQIAMEADCGDLSFKIRIKEDLAFIIFST